MAISKFPRKLPLMAGIFVTVLSVAAMTSPSTEQFLSPGGDNEMHEGMACDQCHETAEGTIRQQVQANVYHWLGSRQHGADFLTQPVESADCEACHPMKENFHPQQKLRKSKYYELDTMLGIRECSGCHDHHSSSVMQHAMTLCMHCHEVWGKKPDTTTPTHVELIAQGRWETCLQCHEFHGGHQREKIFLLEDAHKVDTIQNSLHGKSADPYGDLRTPYLKERGTLR